MKFTYILNIQKSRQYCATLNMRLFLSPYPHPRHLRMDGAIKNPTMSHDSSYGLTSGAVELDPNYVAVVFYPR